MTALLLPVLMAMNMTGSPDAETRWVTSTDGTKIAFDVTGTGPVLILLHGGGMNRRSWHTAGYVSRLAQEFTVVTIDIRGNGDSDKPTSEAAYAFERLNEDVLAVADAVGARRFGLWASCTARRRTLSRLAFRSRGGDGLYRHQFRPGRRRYVHGLHQQAAAAAGMAVGLIGYPPVDQAT